MTASAQDFDIYAGDDGQPVFTVTDGATPTPHPIDLSTASEIEWIAYKDISLASALTKKKSTAGVLFVTDGKDGAIKIAILNADTSPLDGWYFHSAVVTDALGNKTTFEVGRMAVLQRGTL